MRTSRLGDLALSQAVQHTGIDLMLHLMRSGGHAQHVGRNKNRQTSPIKRCLKDILRRGGNTKAEEAVDMEDDCTGRTGTVQFGLYRRCRLLGAISLKGRFRRRGEWMP